MSAATMSADPTPIIAVLDIQPTYSAREAAVLLGRSYSWLDQRLRQDQFIRPNATTVQPLRTQGGLPARPPTARPSSTRSRAECLLMGSSWVRSAFTCQPPRTADNRLWDGEPLPEPENHQDWRAHVVSSRRANQHVQLASGLSQVCYRDGRCGCAGARPVMWVKVSLSRLTISSGTRPSLRGSRRTRPPRSKL